MGAWAYHPSTRCVYVHTSFHVNYSQKKHTDLDGEEGGLALGAHPHAVQARELELEPVLALEVGLVVWVFFGGGVKVLVDLHGGGITSIQSNPQTHKSTNTHARTWMVCSAPTSSFMKRSCVAGCGERPFTVYVRPLRCVSSTWGFGWLWGDWEYRVGQAASGHEHASHHLHHNAAYVYIHTERDGRTEAPPNTAHVIHAHVCPRTLSPLMALLTALACRSSSRCGGPPMLRSAPMNSTCTCVCATWGGGVVDGFLVGLGWLELGVGRSTGRGRDTDPFTCD